MTVLYISSLSGLFAALLKDIPKLTSILTYHVVAGDNNRPTRNGKSFVTLNGKEISAKVTVDTTDVSCLSLRVSRTYASG
jgi:uncharacterized surface protein with fasciclin (FAS1) repeats